jgi:hypothetical protein
MGALDLELEPTAASAWEERAEGRRVVKDAATAAATSPRAALAARNAQMRELKPSSPVAESADVAVNFDPAVAAEEQDHNDAADSTCLTESHAEGDSGLLPAGPVNSSVAAPKVRLLDASLAAIKRTFVPGLVLQSIALLLIVVYYTSSSAKESFDHLADLKAKGGLLFSGLSTALFGGLIPTLASWAREDWAAQKKKRAQQLAQGLELSTPSSSSSGDVDDAADASSSEQQQQQRQQQARAEDDAHHAIVQQSDALPMTDETAQAVSLQVNDHDTNSATGVVSADGVVTLKQSGLSRPLLMLANLGYWLEHGMEVDLWFRLQGLIWGEGNDVATIVAKTLTDQSCYSILWAIPFSLVWFRWRDSGFQFRSIVSTVTSRKFWTVDVPQTLIGSWLVWIPAVALIFCLPPTLQIPLFVLVSCFWSLLLQLLVAS